MGFWAGFLAVLGGFTHSNETQQVFLVSAQKMQQK